MTNRIGAIFAAARPQQWIKNLFIFAPLLFSQHLFERQTILLSAAGFLLFSLCASCVYLLNDLIDREKDRQHPLKRNRPIASGRLPVGWAVGTLAVMIPLVIAGSFAADTRFGAILTAYLLLNVLYSYFLKEVVIIDVMTIAASFVLRIVAGALIIHVPVSEWLLICTTLLSLFLGFSKRRHELTILEESAQNHRPVLSEYSPYFLDQMMSLVTAATLICYILYTVDRQTVEKFHSKNLLITVPFVLYGLFRFLYLVHQKKSGKDPTAELFTDRPLILDILAWGVTVVIIIYAR